MELRTLEVRWFLGGPCPSAVENWFDSGRLVGETEHRTDEYLILAGCHDLGVKRRGGTMLDLKLRTGARAGLALVDGLAGRPEAWIKRSFLLDQGLHLSVRAGWLRVEKARRSRLYQVEADGSAEAVSTGLQLRNGCAAELVALRVGRHVAWGFGFEAFTSELSPEAVLVAAAGAFVAETPLGTLEFDVGDSLGYPAWLQLWPGRE
jgi:hypothetical protein